MVTNGTAAIVRFSDVDHGGESYMHQSDLKPYM
ncbi:hypothetical protein N783_14340 [Pontibacillus marinus BH030004 = DSM 16465]|uniref:Uncharacterized protein n=1 Tax=Pontibacillus marinus BH030004 = DSM 16465 TaxID=1385511 RepID=A0A0A5HLN6_9BACI|nr:hypothetical protein N783_14340 [Pontibacillus marinus BH030004 = DSM 16465]